MPVTSALAFPLLGAAGSRVSTESLSLCGLYVTSDQAICLGISSASETQRLRTDFAPGVCTATGVLGHSYLQTPH